MPPDQEFCASDADGLWVTYLLHSSGGTFPYGGVTGIFLHHLQLPGPDPAHWTTHPLG